MEAHNAFSISCFLEWTARLQHTPPENKARLKPLDFVTLTHALTGLQLLHGFFLSQSQLWLEGSWQLLMHQRAKQVTWALSSSQPVIKAVPRKRMFLFKKQQGRQFATCIPAREDSGIHISNTQRTVQCKIQPLRLQRMDMGTKAQPGLCRGPGWGAHGSSPQGTGRLPGTSLAWLYPRAGSAQPWHSPVPGPPSALAWLHVLISCWQKPCLAATELKSHSWSIPWLLTETNNSI